MVSTQQHRSIIENTTPSKIVFQDTDRPNFRYASKVLCLALVVGDKTVGWARQSPNADATPRSF